MSFDPISAAMDLGGKLIDRLIPDPAQKSAAALELLKLQQSGQLAQMTQDTQLAQAQIDLDKAEASGGSAFNGGWRPLIGYVCALVLLNHFVIAPFAVWGMALAGVKSTFPDPAMGDLWTLMLGMLGLGGMRTLEKVKGVAS